MAASVAIVTVAASAATAVRVVRAKKKSWRKRSKNHGRSWCTPSVFPPPQDLPVHGSECAEDRLQGFQTVDALCFRARQDRAEPHHRRLRQEAARTRARHQARPIPRPLAVLHTLNSLVCGVRAADQASWGFRVSRRWLGFQEPRTAR